MHGQQACLFKYITDAAFRIYAQHGDDCAKQGGWRPCINSHGTYIIDHIKIIELCLNFCGNPDIVNELYSLFPEKGQSLKI